MALLSQLAAFMLSILLTFLPQMPFLDVVTERLQDFSLSQQAKEAITDTQRAHVAKVMEQTNAAYGNLTVEELAQQLEEKDVLGFAPVTWIPQDYRALAVSYVFAGFFSINDGLNPVDVFQMQVNLAVEAQIVARTAFTLIEDNYLKCDACAHFRWANNTTRLFGFEASRVHLINYELAVLVVQPVIRYMQDRFNAFLQEGKNEAQARSLAMVESGAYALNYRELLLQGAEDFDGWNETFGNAEVMDLWNNNQGRLAAVNASLPGGSYQQFLAHWDNGSLIVSETDADATMEKRQFIFENKSLWHPLVKP